MKMSYSGGGGAPAPPKKLKLQAAGPAIAAAAEAAALSDDDDVIFVEELNSYYPFSSRDAVMINTAYRIAQTTQSEKAIKTEGKGLKDVADDADQTPGHFLLRLTGNETAFYNEFCPERQGDGKYPQDSVIFKQLHKPLFEQSARLRPDKIPDDSSAIIIALTADLNIDESMSDKELKERPWTVILPVHERIKPSSSWGGSGEEVEELPKYHFFEDFSACKEFWASLVDNRGDYWTRFEILNKSFESLCKMKETVEGSHKTMLSEAKKVGVGINEDLHVTKAPHPDFGYGFLEVGDHITKVGEKKISNLAELSDTLKFVAGDEVRMTVERNLDALNLFKKVLAVWGHESDPFETFKFRFSTEWETVMPDENGVTRVDRINTGSYLNFGKAEGHLLRGLNISEHYLCPTICAFRDIFYASSPLAGKTFKRTVIPEDEHVVILSNDEPYTSKNPLMVPQSELAVPPQYLLEKAKPKYRSFAAVLPLSRSQKQYNLKQYNLNYTLLEACKIADGRKERAKKRKGKDGLDYGKKKGPAKKIKKIVQVNPEWWLTMYNRYTNQTLPIIYGEDAVVLCHHLLHNVWKGHQIHVLSKESALKLNGKIPRKLAETYQEGLIGTDELQERVAQVFVTEDYLEDLMTEKGYTDPISLSPITDISPDDCVQLRYANGTLSKHRFERSSVLQWLQYNNQECPVTRQHVIGFFHDPEYVDNANREKKKMGLIAAGFISTSDPYALELASRPGLEDAKREGRGTRAGSEPRDFAPGEQPGFTFALMRDLTLCDLSTILE